MSKPTNPKDLLGLKKTPLRLLPPTASIECSMVMGLGAKKYGAYNWRENSVRHTVYLEAALRHILQALDGEDADKESGRPHEAHAMACMAILLDAKHGGNLIDDRNKSGTVAKLIDELIEKNADQQTVSTIVAELNKRKASMSDENRKLLEELTPNTPHDLGTFKLSSFPIRCAPPVPCRDCGELITKCKCPEKRIPNPEWKDCCINCRTNPADDGPIQLCKQCKEGANKNPPENSEPAQCGKDGCSCKRSC